MALRFGPKQAIDAFLLPTGEDAGASMPDPREPPHPARTEAVDAARPQGVGIDARQAQTPFSHSTPGRPAQS